MDLTSSEAELSKKALLASFQKDIYDCKIKEEKSKQEEIRTLEKKKELAPLYLLKHFFSFSEKLIHRIYRKPHDIEPQLGALFLAGENKKATQLLIRELESIIVDVRKELVDSIKAEGFEFDG